MSNLVRCDECKLTIESEVLPFGWLVDPIYKTNKGGKKVFVRCKHICINCSKNKNDESSRSKKDM